MKYDRSLFLSGLEELEIHLNERQMEQFEQYYDLLIETNQKMNLTAITEWEDVVRKHFIDSLSLVTAVEAEDITRLIDVGTGAGFPGIPLKIAFPEIEITLFDSLGKRVQFLQTVIDALQLKKIEVIHARAEDLAQDKRYRERYDVCVSRAVAQLSVLAEYCLPFVEEGGLFIAYKGQDVTQECKKSEGAVEKLGGIMADVLLFDLPDSDIEHSLVVIEKESHTPKQYPRKAGLPEKRPLS